MNMHNCRVHKCSDYSNILNKTYIPHSERDNGSPLAP